MQRLTSPALWSHPLSAWLHVALRSARAEDANGSISLIRSRLRHKHRIVADALERIAKVDLPEIRPTLGSDNIWGYRNKMEYTFSNKNGVHGRI